MAPWRREAGCLEQDRARSLLDAVRKRDLRMPQPPPSFPQTQHVLNGGAAPTDAKDLFVDGGEDSATEASHISKTLLAHLTEEPKIQNHSCIRTLPALLLAP